jgi:hypothetical protein
LDHAALAENQLHASLVPISCAHNWFFAIGMASCAFGAKWVLTPAIGTTGAVLSTILAYCAVSVPGQIYTFKPLFKSKD